MNLRKDHYRCVEKSPSTVRCFVERYAYPGRRVEVLDGTVVCTRALRGPKRRDWLRLLVEVERSWPPRPMSLELSRGAFAQLMETT